MKKYLEDFLNHIRIERNLSDNTLIAYKKDLEQYFESCEIENLKDLNKYTVRKFLNEISNLSPNTRKRKLSALRTFMGFLSADDIIDKNFASEIKNPKIDKKLPTVMSVDETVSIIESACSDQDRAILEVLYGTGCRVAELVEIKLSDIDFDNRRVRLFGKGGKERIVPINNASIGAIKKHLANRKSNDEHIFPMTTRNVRRIVYKYGGKEIHPHLFRHSYATHLHANGASIMDIKEMLGHVDISTTQIYTHIINDNMTKAYRHAHPRG